jgi:hypothetical protein
MSNYQRLSVFAVLFVFVCAGVYAQETAGHISGVVKDETGGVLPGVEVTARNTGTEATRTVVSDDEGRYRLPNLAPGDYELRAELAGFQTAILQNISLSVAQQAVVGVTLRVGEISEQVVVSAEVALVETTSGTVAALVDSQQISDLPLNGRDWTQLAALQEGVVIPQNAGRSVIGNQGIKIIIAGALPHDNAVLLDGIDIKNQHGSTPGSTAGVMLGVDAVREFKVLTSAYTAEYGRFTGGVITAVTKSGTNELHGSLFEYHRNSALDARNFFDRDPLNPLERSKVPNFIRNQFGFTLGGPVVKDSTFFFGSYEGLRERLTTTAIEHFPNAAARADENGIGIIPFSRFRGRSICSGAERVGDECHIQIPDYMAPYIDLMPLPNLPPDQAELDTGIGSFLYTNPEPTNEDYFVIKVDQKLSESDDFFARYTFDDADNKRINQGVRYTVFQTSRNQYVTLEEKHIFSTGLLNEVRFGFTRTVGLRDEVDTPGWEIDEKYWFIPPEQVAETPFNGGLGELTCRGCGINNFGKNNGVPGLKTLNTFQTADNLIFTRGRHSLKMGGNWTRFQFNQMGTARIAGSYLYDNIAQLMRADFTTASVHFGDLEDRTKMSAGLRQNLIGFYIQDDFQFRPNLTLNLGLRYEFITSPIEVNGRLSNLQDNTPVAGLPGPLQPTVTTGNPYFANPSLKNFSPRLAFAWDPTGSGKFSVRGGAGLFYQQILQWAYLSSVFRSTPFALRMGMEDGAHDEANCGTAATNFVGCGGIFVNTFPDGLARVDKTHPGVLFPNNDPVSDPNQPYLIQWSLTLQREIASSTALTATYSGSHSVKNPRLADHNRPTATFANGEWFYECDRVSRSGRCETRRANSNFLQMKDRRWDSNSWYHSLRLGLRKRFSSGFSYQLSYQFSKSIDQGSTTVSNPSSVNTQGYRATNWLDHRIDQGPSAYNVPHVFSANWVYELPFGAGATGVVGQLIGGWSINGILNLADGPPLSITGGHDVTCDNFCSDVRPSLKAGGTSNPAQIGEPTAWFGTSAVADNFEAPAPGHFGNIGRNSAMGPGVATLDFSIHKRFSINEEAQVQFRAEFFNIVNRTNFGSPRRAALSSSGGVDSRFGEITSTNTTSRQIQLALRIEF